MGASACGTVIVHLAHTATSATGYSVLRDSKWSTIARNAFIPFDSSRHSRWKTASHFLKSIAMDAMHPSSIKLVFCYFAPLYYYRESHLHLYRVIFYLYTFALSLLCRCHMLTHTYTCTFLSYLSLLTGVFLARAMCVYFYDPYDIKNKIKDGILALQSNMRTVSTFDEVFQLSLAVPCCLLPTTTTATTN